MFSPPSYIPANAYHVKLEMLITDRKRFIIGLHTVFWAAFIKSKLNPMLKLYFDQLVDTREELLQSLEDWCKM
jgi:hypothetical protein